MNYDDLEDWRYDTLANGTRLLYEYLPDRQNIDLIVPDNRTELNISSDWWDIDDVPFQNKTKFNSVDLNNVPFIDNSMASAFSQCHNIKSVTNINSNISSRSFAFSYCNNLVDGPVIPNSVTDLSGAFCYCSKLEKVTLKSGIKEILRDDVIKWCIKNRIKYTIDKKVL